MGSAQVDVRVMSHGEEVDSAPSRPVRLIRADLAGVVYAGSVYPLHLGDTIDLAEERYRKDACASFVQDWQEIPYAVELEEAAAEWGGLDDDAWYVETNRWGHYVVFDSSEDEAEEVAAALDEAVGLVRWDASHRAAKNGRRYDWFARLSVSPGLDHGAVVAMVRPVLAGGDDATVEDAVIVDSLDEPVRSAFRRVWERGSHLKEENDWLRSHAHELHGVAHASAAEADELRSSMAELQRKLMRLRAKADTSKNRIAALHEDAKAAQARHERELSAAASKQAELTVRLREAQNLAPDPAEVERRVAELIDQVAAAEAARSSALEELRMARDQTARLSGEGERLQRALETRDEEVGFLEEHAARLEQDRENLAGQLAELSRQDVEQQTVRRVAGRDAGKRGSIQESVAKLLRPLQVDEESIETLLDFPDARATLRWLVRIANKEVIEIREGAHTKVKGYPGWWEVHKIHIGDKGNAAAGRIYYQHEQDGYKVRIHRKEDEAEQRQYMKRALR